MLLALLGLLVVGGSSLAQPAAEEAQLVAVLRSDAAVVDKAAACVRLKQIGTAASVPALAALLTDEWLTGAARYALESMPCPEAGAALLAALKTTSGMVKAGIIDALGGRGEEVAVPDLAALLGDADAAVAASAAKALGRLGGPRAVAALDAALQHATPGRRAALDDGLLRAAAGLAAAGRVGDAETIWTGLCAAGVPEYVRLAAWHGRLTAPGGAGLRLLAGALTGDDAAARMAALQAAHVLAGTQATKALAGLLPKLAPGVAVDVLGALQMRGDATALPAVKDAAAAKAVEVRIAALHALGDLGDRSVIDLLAARAAKGGPEAGPARGSLVRLRGDAGAAMLARLPKAEPEVQVVLARALAERHATAGVPALLALAQRGRAAVQVAALDALGQLADAAQATVVLDLLVATRSDEVRDAAEAALSVVVSRLGAGDLGGPVLAAYPDAAVPAKCALLRLGGVVGGADAVALLRAHIADPEPAVAEAALRTYADVAPVEALADLLDLAHKGKDVTARGVALKGYWRLVGLAGERPAAERLKLCQDGLSAAERPAERMMGLSALGRVALPEALDLAEQAGADEAVREEAEMATLQIATALLGQERAAVEPKLRRLAADSQSERVKAAAAAALQVLRERTGYIVPWLVCGPYRQAGLECQALFDVAFPPESPNATGIEWRPSVGPADPLLFWQVELGGETHGNHCVLYLQTRVYVPQATPLKIDIGTDDGIKLWLNGDLVFGNNAVRGLTPDQDHATGQLRQGWNDLLAKITQHTAGCGATIRFRSPDGTEIEGLSVDPRGGA